MGGIGKTQLAVEYCYRHRADFPGGVFWINAAEPIEEGLALIGRILTPSLAHRSLDEQLHEAINYLSVHEDSLLVLDNLPEPDVLNMRLVSQIVPAALPCHLMFTTRRRDLGLFTAIEVSVPPGRASVGASA